MVLGEMAPKSWAIAHPERSATVLALPFRGFTLVVRPVISVLNAVSDALLRLFKVRPREGDANPRTPEQLQHLVEESRRLGLIEADDHAVLTQALHAPNTGIAELITPIDRIVGVPAAASAQDVVDACLNAGRSRLIVGPAAAPLGVVHIRDAYLARRRSRDVTAEQLAYRVPALHAGASVSDAVSALRARPQPARARPRRRRHDRHRQPRRPADHPAGARERGADGALTSHVAIRSFRGHDGRNGALAHGDAPGHRARRRTGTSDGVAADHGARRAHPDLCGPGSRRLTGPAPVGDHRDGGRARRRRGRSLHGWAHPGRWSSAAR
ncbi:CNNM domain-containing protein [Nonomuraea ferruginea]